MADQTLIYHFTHRDNLTAILESGCLHCNNQLTDKKSKVSIAHSGIQERRHQTKISIEPFGTLHDYVPFYFATRQPMLFAIHNNRVEGYEQGQNPLIYLVSSVEKLQENDEPFIFTDGHATIGFTGFYSDWMNDRDKIDWPLMKETYWADTDDDPDRKRRRQAELLVHKQFSLECVIGVATVDINVQQWVVGTLQNSDFADWPVRVRQNWYF